MCVSAGSGARVSLWRSDLATNIYMDPPRRIRTKATIIHPSSGFVHSIAAITDGQRAAVSGGRQWMNASPRSHRPESKFPRPKVSHRFAFSHLKSSPSFGMLHGAASIISLGTDAPRRTVPPPRSLLCAQHAQAFLFPDRPCVNNFMTERIVNQRPGDPEWAVSWQHVRSAMT